MSRLLCTIVETSLDDDSTGAWDPEASTIWLDIDVEDRLVSVLHEVLHWLLGHDDAVTEHLHDEVESAAQSAADLLTAIFPALDVIHRQVGV